MLLHQVIVVLVATAKRFESVLLSIPTAIRRMLREEVSDSDLQGT